MMVLKCFCIKLKINSMLNWFCVQEFYQNEKGLKILGQNV